MMKDKIKDASKKYIVEAYQKQVREAIDNMIGIEEKMSTAKKEYVKGLEANIIKAPYDLGYLEVEKKKKG